MKLFSNFLVIMSFLYFGYAYAEVSLPCPNYVTCTNDSISNCVPSDSGKGMWKKMVMGSDSIISGKYKFTSAGIQNSLPNNPRIGTGVCTYNLVVSGILYKIYVGSTLLLEANTVDTKSKWLYGYMCMDTGVTPSECKFLIPGSESKAQENKVQR